MVAWVAILALGGCVHVYQPMAGLHRPVVVALGAPNFQDLNLTVHCVPGELLTRRETGMLCRRVGTLFENQGAIVRTIDTVGRFDEFDDYSREEEEDAPPRPRYDLILELRAREVHQANHPLSWALCVATFTLVPGVTESTFAQEVVIRDETGFLLVSETLEGRLISRFGAGTFFTNWVIDLARPKEDKVTRGAARNQLSSDLYHQLSQLVFNAKMHWEVLQKSAPDDRAVP